jgi:hypothetical protein
MCYASMSVCYGIYSILQESVAYYGQIWVLLMYVAEKEEDEEEDEGDIIDGCCVLDFDIAGLKTSIRIRARYIRIFDHIAKLFDEVVYPG